MKPSEQWVYSSETWEARKELLTNKICMTCYRRPETAKHIKPAMWVYVHKPREDGTSLSDSDILERIRFMDDDPLMMECVAHEMRKKYGAT